jgi:hypothetical protein
MAKEKEIQKLRKDKIIRARVTEEEHEAFMQLAKKNGYNSASEFIRSLIAGRTTDKNES